MLSDIPQLDSLTTSRLQKTVRMNFWETVKPSLAEWRAKQEPAQFVGKAEAQYQAWLQAEEHEDECYVLATKDAFTQALLEKDQQRDPLTLQVKNYFTFYAQNTVEPAKQQAAQALLPVWQKYAIDVKAAYALQTTQTAQWIDEMEQTPALTAALETLGLTQTVAQLKQVNQDIRNLLAQRDQTDSTTQKAAYRTACTATDEEWRLLVLTLNAYAVTSTSETLFTDLFALVNKQIDNARQQYEAERRKNTRRTETLLAADAATAQGHATAGKLFRTQCQGYEPQLQLWDVSQGNSLIVASLDGRRLISRVELTLHAKSPKGWDSDNSASRGTATQQGRTVTIDAVNYPSLSVASVGTETAMWVESVKVSYEE